MSTLHLVSVSARKSLTPKTISLAFSYSPVTAFVSLLPITLLLVTLPSSASHNIVMMVGFLFFLKVLFFLLFKL
ncbi:hypothetical protein EV361DRAFT_915865 [Lentinula raphanica]|nr:hypothetical protein EV361DRAFT_915865 [Lentinula raphanica]